MTISIHGIVISNLKFLSLYFSICATYSYYLHSIYINITLKAYQYQFSSQFDCPLKFYIINAPEPSPKSTVNSSYGI